MTIPVKERLIVALDVPAPEQARKLVEQIGSHVQFYKMGLELFMADGFWELMDWLTAKQDKKVFADLKFHDIPRTVGAAVKNLSVRGATLTTIHAAQPAMIEEAAKAKGSMKLLAVTVLTSMTEQDCRDTGCEGMPSDLAARRALLAVNHGCDGIVCSGIEAAKLRHVVGGEKLIVTPGIRVAGEVGGDQKRVVDITTALQQGADHLVIGRPIIQAPDPAATAASVQQEIAAELRA